MKTIYALIFLITCSLHTHAQEDVYEIYRWEDVQGVDPDTIFGLSFSKMKLTELPAKLSEFTNLRSLNLEKNKLRDLPNYIGDFKQLEILNVGKNQLQLFPLEVCRMQALKRLILNRNQFETIPECIGFAKELRYLDVYDTPIRSIPGSLVDLKKLEEIDFTGIRFNQAFQDKWNALLPGVKLVFDTSCDCID